MKTITTKKIAELAELENDLIYTEHNLSDYPYRILIDIVKQVYRLNNKIIDGKINVTLLNDYCIQIL